MSGLGDRLAKLEGRPYGRYKDLLAGERFSVDGIGLCLQHVQGDPFAAPSRLDLAVPLELAALPSFATATLVARRASADFVQRAVVAALAGRGAPRAGSGKSGLVEISPPGPEVLDRTGVRVEGDGSVLLRLSVGLPAAGRRILGHVAAELLVERLPTLACELFDALDADRLRQHVQCVEDQQALRGALDAAGLVAFLAAGSLLPRRTGADARPMRDAILLEIPSSLAVELHAPHAGSLRGLGIPKGVTLVTGGGYHGKSTLLQAIALGVYDHAPADGREACVTDARAVSVRAEDGRSVCGVDLRGFIGNLPSRDSTTGRVTDCFHTADASGSTSQAASMIEALEVGARTLLIDEDTAATNFMMRDARMRALVPEADEPITPYLDRVRGLWEERGVSTVLVVGGAGDYLDVADTVIQMDAYKPRDATERARQVAAEFPLLGGRSQPVTAFEPTAPRVPDPRSLDPSRGRRAERVRSVRTRAIEFGSEEIDVSLLYQLVDPAQSRAIGDALLAAKHGLADGERSLPELLDAIEAQIDQHGFDAICEPGFGDRARPRRFEIAAALNRLRALRLVSA